MSLHLPTPVAGNLPGLIDRAAAALINARSSAEILEARDCASAAYDAAKKAARLSKAKGAHDALVAAAHRAQADALDLEAGAKRRLADEYDAAQERGEIASASVRSDIVPKQNDVRPATSKEAGFGSRKEIYEARLVRDAEAADPGIVRRALDKVLDAGEEPTREALRRVVVDAALKARRGGSSSSSRRNPLYRPPSETEKAWSHVYGAARAFVEWGTPENIALAMKGLCEREDPQASNIRAVRDCAATFSKIVELIDAQ